ncbi:iron(III) transport system substrate-binding protein [Microbacterium sp. W4I4]|uniref:ABC transporter substrate-binding protein n=1 Tax=Microbacterium sp. W4I4 TaxID=3042295 RepID=UPI002781878B|nr:ABC transporter substrate-binding protein [Microbacterium sp. W4I4]MDQ0615182.1 iron(III) transport system substrate-binding protein [Microbacterium sp. W4I4]
MRKRSSLLLVGSLSALMGLTACAAPEGSSPAPQTGDTDMLNVACSQQEDFCQAITAAFEEETGITTTYVRLGAGEVLARLDTTPGEFDVWSGGQAENHLLADDRGHVELHVSPNASELPAHYNDESGVWSGFYTDSVAFCSNQKELESLGLEAPTSWDDLLVPELAGSVAMPHPATAGVGYMAMFTVATLNDGDEEATIDYFTKLNANVMQYSKSAATGTEQAGRGEVAVAIAIDSDCEKAIKAGFADLVTSYPEEGTGYEVGAVSILSNAANKANAEKFFDWLLTPAAQGLYADVPSFAAPTHPEASIGPDVPRQDTVNQVDWDIRVAADSRSTYIDAFESRIASSNDAV